MRVRHALVRAALGIYFIWLFISIYILHPRLIETYGKFDLVVFAALVALAVYFAAFTRSILAPLLLWAWMFEFVRLNPLAKEIHFDYLGWMLLYFAIYSAADRDEKSQKLFLRAALLTLGAGYTASGLIKWTSSEWLNGKLLSALNTAGFFLPWTDSLIAQLGIPQWAFLAKFIALLETSALPLILYSRSRFLIWILLTAMQIGLLIGARINHISTVMLIFHALCFDPDWLRKKDQK